MSRLVRILRAVMIGAPGSGKGTISGRLERDFGVVHLSSGDLLRNNVLNRTEVGRQAEEFIDKGDLVPDELMVILVGNVLEELQGKGWLLDGFPRTVAQAEALDTRQDVDIDIVINLDVPFSTIVERIKQRWVHTPSGRIYHTEFNPPKTPGRDDFTGELLSQRADDRPEAVMERLGVYDRLTKPVIEYYRSQSKLVQFSGTESNVLWPHIKSHIDEFLKTNN
ncbi:GTP:AMP phosphotransferase AK3, mitochondrial-like [Corticium candelabrum]|uniref:GTP:AMP phosphotransferase AK3, mitochondrial-like n=1 Tax=Corticium candelabrum TaxID=121492 RepID=UPI002E269193|nr:GTP:AMP phosphotransferase AK3, mitochondrial-like [Corticium candelabrum]